MRTLTACDTKALGPAYARYMAIFGNNFLSNTWRVNSEANTRAALLRASEAFGGLMAANAFEEFWPDIRKRVFHKGNEHCFSEIREFARKLQLSSSCFEVFSRG